MKINRDFLVRHLFAFAVFFGMGCWFSLDAFVCYPAADARELYVAIERSEPPEGADLAAFKESKVKTQRVFAYILLLAASATGLHLFFSTRSGFEWDAGGFSVSGGRHSWSEVEKIDWPLWKKKNILVFSGKGFSVSLDGWHFSDVKDIAARLQG